MPTETHVRPRGSCRHHPPDGSIRAAPGLWWCPADAYLWVSAPVFLGDNGFRALCLLIQTGRVRPADAGAAVGEIALDAMYDIAPDSLDRVTADGITLRCEVCEHPQGRAHA